MSVHYVRGIERKRDSSAELGDSVCVYTLAESKVMKCDRAVEQAYQIEEPAL